eukprot:scaffold226950_cov46-Cyclotella_meneghiniana.AAC.1
MVEYIGFGAAAWVLCRVVFVDGGGMSVESLTADAKHGTPTPKLGPDTLKQWLKVGLAKIKPKVQVPRNLPSLEVRVVVIYWESRPRLKLMCI